MWHGLRLYGLLMNSVFPDGQGNLSLELGALCAFQNTVVYTKMISSMNLATVFREACLSQ